MPNGCKKNRGVAGARPATWTQSSDGMSCATMRMSASDTVAIAANVKIRAASKLRVTRSDMAAAAKCRDKRAVILRISTCVS